MRLRNWQIEPEMQTGKFDWCKGTTYNRYQRARRKDAEPMNLWVITGIGPFFYIWISPPNKKRCFGGLFCHARIKISQPSKPVWSALSALLLICVDEMGTLISPHYLTASFPKLLEKNNLRHIRFHDLRHSCASLMVMNGVSMKQVQEWLGHSTFSTTADIYAHLDYKSKEGSAGVIAGLLEMKK